MADYRNILIDVEGLEEGKFYKFYTDSNATSLLIPKEVDDQLELDIEQLKSDVESLQNSQNSTQIITVSNGGVNPPQEIKTVKVRNSTNVKLSELSANAVMVDYCLFKDKSIECGRLTIIDAEEVLVEEDRTHPSSLLPVVFSVNKLNDVLNLNLNITDSGIYTFKYKIIIF